MKYTNIYLTGFMGSGKTAVGKSLARSLQFEYIDTDEVIERKERRPIVTIFKEDGEPRFRKIERQVLIECAQIQKVVISLGGGTLIIPENREIIKRSGILIYLETSFDTLWERVRSTNKRPLMQRPDGTLMNDSEAIEHMKQLFDVRIKGYRQADLTVQTDDLSVSEVSGFILEQIGSE